MGLPEDHSAKFHKMADAKEVWKAIKSRFNGNDESKKMQKYLLKQQFDGFSVSTSEGLHKGYDSAPQLDYDDLEQINDDDIEEIDLKWQVAMISMRIRKFHKRTGRKLDDGYSGNKARDNGTRPAYQDDSKDLVTINGEDIDWSGQVEEDAQNYAMMAYSSSNSGSDNEEGSSSYTDEIIHSFFPNQSSAPQLDYDDLEQINDDDIEEIDLKWQVAMISMRIRKFHKRTGRKLDDGYNGNKARDNGTRPAYQDDSKDLVTINGEDIDWSGHVEEDAQNYAMMAYSSSNSGSDNEASDLEDTPVNDRFADGMNAVPLLMTGNYITFRPDVEIDYCKFTYALKQTSADESDSKPSEYAFCESDSSVETSTSFPEPVENASKVVCKLKVWTDAPIIEEYESDSDNDSVSNVQEDKEKPSFAFTDSVKHDDPHRALKDKGIVDNGCFRHMTGNKAYLVDYQEFKGGFVAFGGSNGRITGKGKIKTDSKELASPKQTALGKDISNLLMAGRLSKTTLPTRL
nr:ribonuclease H-like domain-containing protein [Tanacetum cinerariifolium]